MKRRALLASGAATIATGVSLSAFGCTPPAPSAPAPGSKSGVPATLRYLIEAQEDPEFEKKLTEHLAEFSEANPDITVELESMPSDTMRTVLQTQLQSGDGPDVFSWGSGPSFAGKFAEAGLLYDLTDAYRQNDWPIYEFAKKRVTVDGRLIGVPGDMETIGIYYNRDLFDQHGLDRPTDLTELEAVAEQLAGAGLIGFAVSDKEGWQAGHLLSMTLSSRIGSDGINDLIAGQASWDSPDVIAALQLWKDWLDAGYLPKNPTAISYDAGAAMFYSGEAAMLPTGSWFIPEVVANSDAEVGYIPFPAPDGPGIFTAGLGSGPLVSATTAYPEAAITFVDFLVSPEHGRWAVENLHTLPPYPVDTSGVDVSPLFAQVIEDTADLAGGSADLGTNIDVASTAAFNEAMYDGFQAIFTGQRTPDQVAADLQAAASGD